MAGDLNLKKSWNPALVKNQKKVWQEEQNKLDELKRIRELNKEHDREQEYLRMLKLQHGSEFDTKDLSAAEKLRLNKLDWMYKDVPESKLSKNEAGFIERSDELPDKAKVESLLAGNHAVRAARNMSVMDKVVQASSHAMPKAPQRLDDDPLLKIQREQRVAKFSRNQHASAFIEKDLSAQHNVLSNVPYDRHARSHNHLSRRSHHSSYKDETDRSVFINRERNRSPSGRHHSHDKEGKRLSSHSTRDERDCSPSKRHHGDKREEARLSSHRSKDGRSRSISKQHQSHTEERSQDAGSIAANTESMSKSKFTSDILEVRKNQEPKKSLGLMY